MGMSYAQTDLTCEFCRALIPEGSRDDVFTFAPRGPRDGGMAPICADCLDTVDYCTSCGTLMRHIYEDALYCPRCETREMFFNCE